MSSLTAAALACYVVAFAEVSGIVLVVLEAAAARRELTALCPQLAHERLEVDGRALRRLLQERGKQGLAVCLLIGGVVAGFAGNLLTLPW